MDVCLVSVLIVTWNRKQDVLVAVQSVYDQAYADFEIVVVDNGSSDDTVEALREAYPEVRLVTLGRNTGIASGRNAGIAAAQGDIIFCLDSDAGLRYDTLANIVWKLNAEPKVGIITCKVLSATTEELDPNAWIFTESDKRDQDSEFLSHTFCEAAVAIRSEVFEQAGVFWDLLFFGREGDDLALRVWDAGYKILYLPEAIVYHRASPQRSVTGNERLYYDLRNSLYIYLVRYPWWMLVFFVPLRIGISLVKGIRRCCLRSSLRALLDVARKLPSLRRQRHPIRNETARRYLGLLRERGSLAWDLRSWLKYKA